MIWRFLALFAAFSCRLLLLAAVFWDVLQIAPFATSVAPKWYQNALQRPQNTSKIDPKLPPGASWAHQVEPKSYFFVWGSILEPNLVPLGAQNQPKNRYFARKMLQGARLQSNVCLARCITSFFTPFLVVFAQKTMKKTSRCCASCRGVPPLKNHVFYRLPCLRTVFLRICWNTGNLTKKRWKNMKSGSVDYITKFVTKSLP